MMNALFPHFCPTGNVPAVINIGCLCPALGHYATGANKTRPTPEISRV